MRTEFRLSGSGGQGLLLAGIVLAEAAIHEGKNAVQTQSYGPEARGGASKAEVVVSDEDIDYAVRLRHAGVPVELHVYPGAPHGYDSLAPTSAIARRWASSPSRSRT